jgi:hypothetical protein
VQTDQTIQRRDFLSRVAAGGAAGLVGSGAVQAWADSVIDGDGRHRVMRMTADDYEPHLGDRFVLQRNAESAVTAQLVEVKPLEAAGPRPSALPRKQPFSLVFRTHDNQELVQDTYRVRHQEIGEVGLFLVPVGPERGGRQLEAVFS